MLNEQECLERFRYELKTRMANMNIRAGHISYNCEIDRNKVYDYLHGPAMPNPWKLVLIADQLNCSVNELFGLGEFEDAYVYPASEKYAGENQFAEAVRDRMIHWMTIRDISLEDLRKTTGYTANTISQWFTRWPKLMKTSQVIRVANALDCTPSDLLGY